MDLDSKPLPVGPPTTSHFKVLVDTPKGIHPFQPAIPVSSSSANLSSNLAPPPPPATTGLNLDLRRQIYESTALNDLSKATASGDKRDELMLPAKNCFTCGVDCRNFHYHNVRTRSHSLCPSCFADGRFPNTMQSSDFLRVQPMAKPSGPDQPWSDQEALKLLEGLEMYEEDWAKIAEHVGTRTREQCVLQFLQLPIEEAYLEPKAESLGPFQYARLPFSQADNPVLSVLAFLASAVSPGVAAAASKAAIEELAKKDGEEKGEDIQAAAAMALGAAAAKAQTLATYEERELQRLVNACVEEQIRKMELKMRLFEEMEAALEAERDALEVERRKLLVERLELRSSSSSSVGAAAAVSASVGAAVAAGSVEKGDVIMKE